MDRSLRCGPRRVTRRDLLAAGAAGAALGLASSLGAARGEDAPLPRRALGQTGFETTILGLGCFPLGGVPDDDEAVSVVLRALDAGCNYLDTAPSYARGRSESRVGRALRERPDAKVFLATKTHTRTADEARRDLEGSLERLGLEQVDMVQVHAVTDEEDLERVLDPKGPIAGLVKAKEEGLVRFIGVTGHADPAVVRKTIRAWPFDAVLFPLNCVDTHYLSFESGTLPAAVEKGLGRVAMKAFASGNLTKHGIDATDCLRYVFGLDVSTVVVGCRTVAEVDHAIRTARTFRPLETKERAALLARTLAHRGRDVEWYKRA